MFRHDWFWLGLSRLVMVVATLANFAFATRLLGAKGYGLVGLALTAHSFVALFFISPAGQHLNKRLHVWWREGTFFQRIHRFGIYTFGVSGLAAMIVYGYWRVETLSDAFLWAFAVACLLFASTWSASMVSALNLLGWAKLSAVLQCLNVLLGLLLSGVLFFIHAHPVMWLWGQVMGLLITAAVANLYLRTKQDKFPAFDTPVFMNRQEFWQFSLPLAAAALLMWFQWNSWRPIVQSHFGTEQLGAMLAGYLLASYFWGVVEGTTHQALHPSFFAKTHHRADVSKQAYQDFVCVLAPLYGLTASLAITLSPWIVLLMPGRQFHLAPLFFAWGVAIELCRVLTGLLMHTAQIRKTSYATIPPYLAGIFVGLVCVSAIQFFHAWTVFTLTSSVLASALAVLWAALWINKDYFVPSDLPRSSYLIGGVLLISCAIAAFGLLHPTDGLTTLSLAAFGSLGVAIVAHRVWGEIQVTYHRLTSIGSDIP